MKRSVVFCTVATILLTATCCIAQENAMAWQDDFKHQPVGARPKIEARYVDARRTGLDIWAQRYRMIVDIKSEAGQKIRKLQVGQSEELLVGDGAFVTITDACGKSYSSLFAKSASRINIYRRGPYYIETHWLDVELVDADGAVAPIKGEIVFYSYPEKTHVAVILHVTKAIEIKNAKIAFDFNAQTCASPASNDYADRVRVNEFCLLKRANNAPTCALIYPVPHGVDDVSIEKIDRGVRVSSFIYNDEAHDSKTTTWNEGDKPAVYFELLPLDKSEVSEEMECEVTPLLASAISAQTGKSLGYNPIRGCYTIQSDFEGDFNYYFYKAPNQYEPIAFSIDNNDIHRKVYILHEARKPMGSVECGALLDENCNMLPIMVQISKNFYCELEEPFYNPGDPPFSETIFPLYLKPDEQRKLTSLHLHQNWGNHPLKQFSSLGAWMDYYHMSTGVTETTCYVPFMFAGLNGVSIADFRPMSQKMWTSQPQHDNVAGHSFLSYKDENDKLHFIEYFNTTFRSTGPNWADMSMGYISDDGKVKVTIDVFEIPQLDELRNFLHIRVDFLNKLEVKDGNISENLRLLKIDSWVQRMRYTKVAYGGPTGNATIVPIRLNDSFTLNAAPLPKQNGWAAVYPDERGANAYIVRRFDGKIGGESVAPGISLIGKKDGNTELYLVPITKADEINADDYIDMDIVLMPYGSGEADEKPAAKCAMDFGLNAPKITEITAGTKISDFPTRLALDDKGRAEFKLTGGINVIPIIIERAKNYSSLRLYNIDGKKKLVDLSYQGGKDGYQVFAKDDGTFGTVFLIDTNGKEHKYIAESMP